MDKPSTYMTLKVGQLYRQKIEPDYGDIHRWRVTTVFKLCAVLQNQATLKEMVVIQSDEAEFLSNTLLIEGGRE